MNPSEIGQLIQKRRKLLGINQQAVCEIADVSLHTLSNIESGKGNPTAAVLLKVLETLGLEIEIKPAAIK